MASNNLVLHDARILNAKTAVAINGQSNHVVSSVQMVRCGNGMAATNTTFSFWNGLMWNVMTNFTGSNSTGDVEHLTVDTASLLNTNQTLNLTNCLLVAVTNTGSFTSNSVYAASSGSSVFQTVGGGSHYLPTNSAYLGAGTTNIAPSLAATLQLSTTYAPVLLTNNFSSNTTLSPAVARDTGVPAIGYHYYPLDFVCHDLSVNAGVTLLVTNGVALGLMDTTGITVYGNLVSQGTPVNLNHLTSVNTAQETATCEQYYFLLIGGNASWQSLSLRFTDMPNLGGQSAQLWMDDGWTSAGYLAAGPITLRDCQMRAGVIWMNLGNNKNPATNSSETLNFTNNVFDRARVYYLRSANRNSSTGDYVPANLVVNNYNNLYHYGLLDVVFNMASFECAPPTNPCPLAWAVYDNLFQSTNFTETGTDSLGGRVWPTLMANGHNGYVNQPAWLSSSGGDVTPAVGDYQTGPLGMFYYPTLGGNLSTLIYAGDQPAANLGLDSETVMTNNVPEGTNIVSIGFHHASVGSVNCYTNCDANPGGALSISSGAFCIGEPAFNMAYWTDVPGQISEVYLGSGGIPVWFSLPVYSTILTNWNVVDWDGSLTTNGGSGFFFTPTNTGYGTNVFYYTYSNPPPCSPGPFTIAISNTFVVVGVASLAPTNTGTWIEISNSTPGTRTFLVQANPTNGHNTLAVYATPTPSVAPANLPAGWSLNGVCTEVVSLNIAAPGVYEVNCVCGTSSLTDFFVVTTNAVTTNSTVDAPCGTGPWQLGYWSFNVPSILLDYWGGESNALDTLGIYTNNGTLYGNVTYTNGVLSNAFYFDGNSSYISFGTNAGNFGTNNFTVDFWMETTATTQEGILDKRPYCGAASMWDMRLESDGTLSVEICQNSSGTYYTGFGSQARVNDGSFHHVSLNRWGTNLILYIDGVLDTKVGSAGVVNIQNSTSLTAGRSACIGSDGTGYFVGILDEITLWQGDVNPWFSSRNWPPLTYYNVENISVTPWTNGLWVDSTNAAKLAYNYIEADGTANLNGGEGAVQFWFNPDWNGGTGTGGPGYWFELGDVYSPGGGWGLVADPAGTGLSFVGGSNGFLITYLTAPIGGWVSNTWHQVVLSYSSNATLLFIDGGLATNGPGLFFEPDLATRLADGFTVGSDHNGSGEAGGVFDELATFNCPLTQAQVTSNYPYPAILAQPVSVTVNNGSTAFFTVVGDSGTPMTNQWQLNGTNLTASDRVTGAVANYTGLTTNVLSIADVSDGDTNIYTVILSNSMGTLTSAPAILTVNDAAQLGVWLFTTTNWIGQYGQLPLLATNVTPQAAWSTNGVHIGTNVAARLVYRDVETNGWANFNCRVGSVVLWFNPDWSSTNAGGVGPGNGGRFIELGSYGVTNDWWALLVDSRGTNLSFCTQSNGMVTTNVTAAISWTNNTWHQVALTYCSNNSAIYVDGNVVSNNTNGVTKWPRRSVRDQGILVGSDSTGTLQIRGILADLETYNYPLNGDDIYNNYSAIWWGGAVYSAGFASKYSSNEFVMASIGGWPSASMMILVNTTNTNSGTWVPFNAYPTVDLGTNDGLRTVNFYFQGLGGLTSRVSKRIWLDTTPPTITITAPGSNTLSQPVLQLQGYANEDIYSISYDLNNANGSVSNQDVLVLTRTFDTNQWRIRTNTFQGFDIGLTPGTNTITLHAMDWAGNMTNVTTNYVLDYSSKTNAPVVQLYWPTNGSLIGGTNFTWRGAVDDPTVTLSAQITDSSGDTNVVAGIVERNGNFWVGNLPLAAGTNWLILTATDANNNVTNITNVVVQSSVILTLTPSSDITWQTTMDVSGYINSTGYSVWVNGLETTTLNDCGGGLWSWIIHDVPVNGNGTAVFQAEAIPTGGSYTGGGGGTNSTLQNPGNPFSPQCAAITEFCPDKLPVIICTEYHQNSTTVSDCPVLTASGAYTNYTYSEDWSRGVGGNWLSTSFTEENDGANPSFGWSSAVWDAYGCGSSSNGWSYVDGDFSSNISGGGGYYDGMGILGPASGGWAAEYEGWNSESDAPLLDYNNGNISDYYITALAYVPGGKSVPVQYVVAFSANADGAPSADWMSTSDYVIRWNQGWTPIPYTDITMAGGRLDTNGYYYKVVSSGSSPIDITPSFDLGPGANNTNLEYAALTGSRNEKTSYDNSYVNYTVDDPSSAPQILFNTSNVTGSTVTVFVGQLINLTCFLPDLPGHPTMSNFNWTVPGNTFSNYVTTVKLGKLYPDFAKNHSDVNFHWAADGTYIVSCTAVVKGQEVHSQNTTFIVKRPVATMSVTTPGQIRVDNNMPRLNGNYLHFGGYLNGTNFVPGIRFQINNEDATGSFFFAQLGTLNRLHFPFRATYPIETNHYGPGLDAGVPATWPYPFDPDLTNVVSDSPYEPCYPTDSKVTIDDSFNMYVMYLNSSPGALPVSLQVVNWNWSAQATQTNSLQNQWRLDSGVPGVSQPVNTVTFPQWTNNVDPSQPRSIRGNY